MIKEWKLTGEAVVMSVSQFIVDEDRHSIVFLLQSLNQRASFCLGNLQTWPAVPLKRG